MSVGRRANREAGSGLTGVVVSIGLGSVMIVALLTAIASSFKQEAVLRGLLQGREFSGEMMELARSPNCGINGLPINITDLSWQPATEYELGGGLTGRFLDIKKGTVYAQMTVDSITISPYRDRVANTLRYVALDGASATDFAGAKRVKGSIKVALTSPNAPKAPVYIPVALGIQTGRIVSCEAEVESQNLMAVCEALGGDWSEIDSPPCKLKCPGGMTNKNGTCVSMSENIYCKVNEKCGVDSKYEIL